MELNLIEETKKNEQKRLTKKGLNLPNIKQDIYNQSSNTLNIDEERHNLQKNKEKNQELEKKLDFLHKEINVGEIFDKFKDIVNFNADVGKKSELEMLKNQQTGKKLFSKIKDTSFLHKGKNGYLPKINSHVKSLEKIDENPININNHQHSENWSPIDIKKNSSNTKEKILARAKLEKAKGFSVKNRQINFKKNESIFLTNSNSNKNEFTCSNIYNPTREKTNSNILDNKNYEYFNLNTVNDIGNNGNINLLSQNLNFSNLINDRSMISSNNDRNSQSMHSSVFEYEG